MPLTLTCRDRVPLERAFELIEASAEVTRSKALPSDYLHAQAEHLAEEIHGDEQTDLHWWVDHALGVLVRHGYLERVHQGLGRLSYRPTPAWSTRDEYLKWLRAPTVKKRRRGKQSVAQGA